MKPKRRLAREVVLLALYQIDIGDIKPKDALCSALEELHVGSGETKKFAEELFSGIIDMMNNIDINLQSLSRKWELFRMSYIDRNILRIATYEILFTDDIPYKVAINEAVELAKTYGDNKSPKFINGILASLIKEKDIIE